MGNNTKLWLCGIQLVSHFNNFINKLKIDFPQATLSTDLIDRPNEILSNIFLYIIKYCINYTAFIIQNVNFLIFVII